MVYKFGRGMKIVKKLKKVRKLKKPIKTKNFIAAASSSSSPRAAPERACC